MSDHDHFDFIPLHLDADGKTILAKTPSPALDAELKHLNSLHHALVHMDGARAPVPPAPIPYNPKRTSQVAKLRDNGNAEYRKGKYPEAGRLYSLGIQMAIKRSIWEPCALIREEVSGLLCNRAQVHMSLQNWPEAAVDAECSVLAKRQGNAKGWWRKGTCLVEMGRLEEARQWVKKGLEVEGEEADMKKLLKEIEDALEKKRIS